VCVRSCMAQDASGETAMELAVIEGGPIVAHVDARSMKFYQSGEPSAVF
jgi:hypothetical protein